MRTRSLCQLLQLVLALASPIVAAAALDRVDARTRCVCGAHVARPQGRIVASRHAPRLPASPQASALAPVHARAVTNGVRCAGPPRI